MLSLLIQINQLCLKIHNGYLETSFFLQEIHFCIQTKELIKKLINKVKYILHRAQPATGLGPTCSDQIFHM